MTKRIVILVLLLALLAPALPARALTNAEKYDAALQGMIGYLSGDTMTAPGDLFAAFSGCSSYQHGRPWRSMPRCWMICPGRTMPWCTW